MVKCWNPKEWKDGGAPGSSLGGFGIKARAHMGATVGFSIPRANSEIALMNWAAPSPSASVWTATSPTTNPPHANSVTYTYIVKVFFIINSNSMGV